MIPQTETNRLVDLRIITGLASQGVEEHLSQVDEKLRTEGAERAERVVKGGPLRPRESTAESGPGPWDEGPLPRPRAIR